uniref:Uncharacterized protein n=2 Tax=Cacopsylla melanoneura TaxID=428564 RepID=A0A8D9EDR0_9HEMI
MMMTMKKRRMSQKTRAVSISVRKAAHVCRGDLVNIVASVNRDTVESTARQRLPVTRCKLASSTRRTGASLANQSKWRVAKGAVAPAAVGRAKPSAAKCVSFAATAVSTRRTLRLCASARVRRNATDYQAPPLHPKLLYHKFISPMTKSTTHPGCSSTPGQSSSLGSLSTLYIFPFSLSCFWWLSGHSVYVSTFCSPDYWQTTFFKFITRFD